MVGGRARPQLRLTALSAYGLLGFVAAAIVHVGTFTGRAMSTDQPLVWILSAGIAPLFVVFVRSVRPWTRTQAGMLGFRRTQLRWREMLPYLPAWAPPFVVLLLVYVFINFFLAISALPAKGGTLTPQQEVYAVRAISGHWLWFYAIPTFFFMYIPTDARPDSDAPQVAV